MVFPLNNIFPFRTNSKPFARFDCSLRPDIHAEHDPFMVLNCSRSIFCSGPGLIRHYFDALFKLRLLYACILYMLHAHILC